MLTSYGMRPRHEVTRSTGGRSVSVSDSVSVTVAVAGADDCIRGIGSGGGSNRICFRNQNRKQGCLLLQRVLSSPRAHQRASGGRAVFDIVPRARRPSSRHSQCLRGQSPCSVLQSWAPARKQVAARPISVVIVLPAAFADHADRTTLGGAAVRWRRSRRPVQRTRSSSAPTRTGPGGAHTPAVAPAPQGRSRSSSAAVEEKKGGTHQECHPLWIDFESVVYSVNDVFSSMPSRDLGS